MHAHRQDGIIPPDGFFKATDLPAKKKQLNKKCSGPLLVMSAQNPFLLLALEPQLSTGKSIPPLLLVYEDASLP